MLHNQMGGGHWKIVDFENITIESKEILNKNEKQKSQKLRRKQQFLSCLNTQKGRQQKIGRGIDSNQ